MWAAMTAEIVAGGLLPGARQAYQNSKVPADETVNAGATIGRGVYCTPKLATASAYAPTVAVDTLPNRLCMLEQWSLRMRESKDHL